MRDYIKPVTKEGTKMILEQMSNCICKINNNNIIGTGFFCKIPFKNNLKINVLLTSYDIINENYFNFNNKINILLGDYNESKIINIDNNRNIYYNKLYNITIIELKDYDNINNYLELDDNLFNNNIKSLYEKESIYILYYLNGGKSLVSYGLINNINGYYINNICYINPGINGAPILNINNNKVIGISLNNNNGIILKYAIEEFINKYQFNMNNNMMNPMMNNINNMMPNMMMNQMMNNINNFQMPIMMMNNINGNFMNMNLNENNLNINNFKMEKMNVIFTTSNGIRTNIYIDIEKTVDQLLKIYLTRVDKLDLYQNKSEDVCFLYNVVKIRYGDQTKLKDFFKYQTDQKITVNYLKNLVPGRIRVVTFKTTGGAKHEIEIFNDYETTSSLLKRYLKTVNRPDLIEDKSNKIIFIYNARKIQFGDNIKLNELFKDDFKPIIVVNDPNYLIKN